MIVDVSDATPSSTTLVSREQILATTATAAGVIQPILGRDGRVLFKGRLDADNVVKLYVVDTDGGNLGVLPMSQIPRTDGTTIAEVASVGLSPDGNQLAFGADETVGAYDLWVVPTSGAPAAPTRLTAGIVPAADGRHQPGVRPAAQVAQRRPRDRVPGRLRHAQQERAVRGAGRRPARDRAAPHRQHRPDPTPTPT